VKERRTHTNPASVSTFGAHSRVTLSTSQFQNGVKSFVEMDLSTTLYFHLARPPKSASETNRLGRQLIVHGVVRTSQVFHAQEVERVEAALLSLEV